MGRFKRKSKKRYHIPKNAVEQYIEKVRKPKSKIVVWTSPIKDNRRLVGIFRKLFLVLKKNKKFGDFIECFQPIEKKTQYETADSVRICCGNLNHGRASLLIGSNFFVPIARDMLTPHGITSTPFGNVIWLNYLLENNWYHKRDTYLGKQDIAEMYLRDAYESKGITKSKVPNEMAFSMRMGTILASIFYLIIAFMFYWFISPLAALIYSLITAFIIVYFLFSFPIN
jgi:hypothetical protein